MPLDEISWGSSFIKKMEKDIAKISKNPDTDLIIRVDDFGGVPGLTIREFIHTDSYTGFTKAGTRISKDKFLEFQAAIASIKIEDFEVEVVND